MIQRIQSVYLFVAVALSVACLCLQIGIFSDGGLVVAREYNLWSVQQDGSWTFSQWPLFAVLLLSAAVGAYAIFAFRNRLAQARLCLFAVLLIVGWYVLYFVYGQVLSGGQSGVSFTPSLTAALPAVSVVFYLLARRGIKADERLVRAADRIR